MANVFIEEQYMSDIGDAIRDRTGSRDLIYPKNMNEEILSIGSAANVTATDMAEGTIAYVNGSYVTGTLPVWSSLHWASVTPTWNSTDGVLKVAANTGEKRIYTQACTVSMYCPGSTLGTATAADVASGKTFTSSAGLKVTGTHVCNKAEASLLSGLHVWKKMNFDGNYKLVETEVTNQQISYRTSLGATTNSWDTANYASTISYSTGSIVLNSPTTITIDSTANADTLKGKYAYISHLYGYYRIPSDATMSITNSVYNSDIKCSKMYKLSVEQSGTVIGYVVSSNSSAYPNNGEQDGYGYVYIGTIASTTN